MVKSDQMVTVLILTFNPGIDFATVLDAVLGQSLDRAFEILVVDSGSTDGTVDLVRKQFSSCRLVQIPNSEFNHGLTRNLGVQHAAGEIVALLSQDALPFNEFWLQSLVDCFVEPRVAGAYSLQLPRRDANPFIRSRIERWMRPSDPPRVQALSENELASLTIAEKLLRARFDNVSSAIRRSAAMRFPFNELMFGEDLDWAYRVLLSGHLIAYQPASKVIHSHSRSMWEEFKRAYLDHQNRRIVLGTQPISSVQQLLKAILLESKYLFRVVGRERMALSKKVGWYLQVVPFALSQSLAQYLGTRSATRVANRNRTRLV